MASSDKTSARCCLQCGATEPKKSAWVGVVSGDGPPQRVFCSPACLETYEVGPLVKLRWLIQNHRRRLHDRVDQEASLQAFFEAVAWLAAGDFEEAALEHAKAASHVRGKSLTTVLALSVEDHERLEKLAASRHDSLYETLTDVVSDALRGYDPRDEREREQELLEEVEDLRSQRDDLERSLASANKKLAEIETRIVNQS